MDVTLHECRRCHEKSPAQTLEQLGGVCLRCLSEFATQDLPKLETLPLAPGDRFKGLEVLEVIARGGMSVVYKARQTDLGRLVALKILSPALAAHPEFPKRFAAEGRALAALSHPNVVQVFDVGREGELHYLVMEHVDGRSLRQILAERSLKPADVLRIVPQICSALEYAHRAGVIHRDIKPENILVEANGRVKVADFGLAKIAGAEPSIGAATETRLVMGTPRYMAPEQYESLKGVDERADIYSLGVVFYEMLTGEVPMGRFDPPSKRMNGDPRLDSVVLKALEREPGRRYQSAQDLRSDVETAVATPAKTRRRALPLIVLGLAACGMLVLWSRSYFTGDLMSDMRAWAYANNGPGGGTQGEELVLVPHPDGGMAEVVAKGSNLSEDFRVKFKMRYIIEGKQEPWLFLMLEAAAGSGHQGNAVIFFPEGDHSIAFASQVQGKGWGLRKKQTIPPGSYGPGRWYDVDVAWESEGRWLRVRFDGKDVLVAQLESKDALHGAWRLALGGAAREVRIREVSVVNRR